MCCRLEAPCDAATTQRTLVLAHLFGGRAGARGHEARTRGTKQVCARCEDREGCWVMPNVRAKLPAEAGAVSLVRDDAPCAADQAYSQSTELKRSTLELTA